MKISALLFLAASLLPPAAQAGIISRTPAGKGDPSFGNWFLVSPDGYHFAVLEVKKGVETLLKDGKVAAKGPQTFSSYQAPSEHRLASNELQASGAFGSSGRLAMVRAVLDQDGQKVGQQVWVDGKAGKVYDAVQGLTMNPRGSRLAYAAQDRDGWHLVVEGAPGPALRTPPTSITFNPAGDKVAYLADGALFIGPKRIRSWDVARVLFSPDWKRVAWIRTDETGAETVGIDEAALGRHSKVYAASFSPSGARFGYAVLDYVDSKLKGLVLIDGAKAGPPVEAAPGEIIFSPSDEAYWFGQLDSKEHSLFKDGAPVSRWEFVTGRPAVAFSPSGAHSAYAAHRDGQRLLVIDGAPEPGGPNVLFGNSGIVFDDEREFHFFASRGLSGLELVCASVGKAPAPEDSACTRKARQVYPDTEEVP